MQAVQELLREACEEVDADYTVSFHNDYSGRGMYGSKCVGISGSWQACRLVIGLAIKGMASHLVAVARESKDPDFSATDEDLGDTEHDFEQAIDKLMDQCHDDMGLGTIIYWPRLEPIPEEG